MEEDSGLSSGRPPPGRVENALRALASTIKSLQLYPAGSPVVGQEVEKAHRAVRPLLGADGLTLEARPDTLRVAGVDLGREDRLIAGLAERIHGHGVARIVLSPGLGRDGLRRLAELLAAGRAEIDEQGGLDWVLQREEVSGVRVELLELERVFDETGDARREPGDIWDALLQGFREEEELEELDWEALASSVDRLRRFIAWVLESTEGTDPRRELPPEERLRFVCSRVGEIAAHLGSEHLQYLVLAVRDLFEKLDREVLLELLAEPMLVEVDAERVPKVRDEREPAAATIDLEPRAGADAGAALDVTGTLAAGLEPAQAEALVMHALQTRERASPRLYSLFSRLMARREDRPAVARQVRAALDQQIAEFGKTDSLLRHWPHLTEVLQGEAPERFVSPDYAATLGRLALEESDTDPWPTERIAPRLSEMDQAVVLGRKTDVLLAVLEDDPGEDYPGLARELERMIPELFAADDYARGERSLAMLVAHAEAEGRRLTDRRAVAEKILGRFYERDNVRQLVIDTFGKPDENVAAISRIFEMAGTRIVPVLMEALAVEKTRRVRERLVRLLCGLGHPVIEEAQKHLGDDRWYFLRNLVLIIGEIGDPELTSELEATLEHDDPRVRRETVRALRKLEDERAGRLLVKATEDDDLEVRLLAIQTLGLTGFGRAEARLRQLLRLPNWFGQNTPELQTATVALGRLGVTEAVPDLERLARRAWLFRGRRRPVREAARWALRALEGKDPGPAPEPEAVRGADWSFRRRAR